MPTTLPLLGAPITLVDPTTGLPTIPMGGAPVVQITSAGVVTNTKWPGALAWGVTSTALSNQWNGTGGVANGPMRVTDVCNVSAGQILQTFVTNLQASTKIYTSMQLSGTNASPVSQVTSANLTNIDNTLQARDGAVAEWVTYGDDLFSGTVANHITQLQTNVDIIHGIGNCPDTGVPFVRANGAPAFQCLYVPAGLFLNNNLAANSILATYPDGVVFQSQIYEDTPNGADPTYIATVKGIVNQLRAFAPTHPAAVQVQTYSNSNNLTVWTPGKMIADINAIGVACNPSWISIFFADTSNQAPAAATFNTTLANYR